MYSSYHQFIVLFLTFLTTLTQSASILGVFPIGGRSLNILYNKLMLGLANAGHDVTVISAYNNKLRVLNGSYTDVLLTGFAEEYATRILDEYHLDQEQESYSVWASSGIHELFLPIYNRTFHHTNVRKLLDSNKQFDLVIVEHLWSESLLAFAAYYQCPSIVFASMGGINPWINDIVGNPMPISYVPHYWMIGDFSRGMNFYQKFRNFLYYVADGLFVYNTQLAAQSKLVASAFPGKTLPTAHELYHSPSMVLLGSHSSIRQAAPLSPNMVEIGGFHIDDPKKLPKDIRAFLDSAREGAVYFSMGSHVRSKDFSSEKKAIFVKVFAKLKIKVLWKFEEESLEGLTDNVLIKKWVPQTDVLAHPNIKLFITHGGHGSTLETVHHGVPALMLPVFIDQFNNALNAAAKGFALKLSFHDKYFGEELLLSMIEEMLNNSTYMRKAKQISALFHDRPMTALNALIYWTEYVIRHKGAEHLRLGSTRLSWHKFYLVDVLLLIVLIVVSAFCGAVYVLSHVACSSKITKIKKH